MIILAIDTSCDDTSLSLIEIRNGAQAKLGRVVGGLESKIEILSNIVSSQVKIHAKYGGVWPFLAKREHQKNLPIVYKKAVKMAKRGPRSGRVGGGWSPKVDLIAVTVGPGLEPCLWTGVNFAKDLAKKLKLPIIPINHIEAHIFANFVGPNSKFKIQNSKLFPAVCLVVSGGHTQLILMKNHGQYTILGETRDDAAGECFDKVARILGLGYPGGPAIAAEAAKFQISNFKFQIDLPRPMINQKNYDFSFSGLKTAVLYKVRSMKYEKTKKKIFIHAMATEVQQAIIDVLIYKTLRAAKEYKAKTIILGGGVAANDELRKQFRKKIKKELPNTKYLIPDTKFCTDNAAMVAVTAYYHWLKGETQSWKKIGADANLRLG